MPKHGRMKKDFFCSNESMHKKYFTSKRLFFYKNVDQDMFDYTLERLETTASKILFSKWSAKTWAN